MGIPERKTREKESLRRTILDAASELFRLHGIEAVSMRMIAQKIEYSPTTIYLHLQDKADLVQAVVDQFFADFLPKVEDLVDLIPSDPLGTLRRGMRAYIDFGVRNPMAYRLAFMAGSPQKPLPSGGEVGLRAYGQLLAMVEGCLASGVFRPADPRLVTNVLWSMNHGITSLLITGLILPGSDQEAVIEASLQAGLDAFRK